MNKNVKQNIETLIIGLICTVWVLSMHQNCSNATQKNNKKTQIEKIQKLQNDTINAVKLEQRVR